MDKFEVNEDAMKAWRDAMNYGQGLLRIDSDGSVEHIDVMALIDEHLTKIGEKNMIHFDAPVVLDASVTNIPKSSDPTLQVIAATARHTSKVNFYTSISSYIGVYVGALSHETLIYVIGSGKDTFDAEIPEGSRVSIRSMDGAINSGSLCCQFYP